MDEILQKLLSSELLSEETRTELTEQFNLAVEALKEDLEVVVKAELTEQFIKEKEALVESTDSKVDAFLAKELAELHEDISAFRDLEVEFAEKLLEEKHKMADTLAEEIDQLVDKLDQFLEMRLSAELSELKEDIDLVKKNEFGRKIFEAFASEFNVSYADEKSLTFKLKEAEKKVTDAEAKVAKLEESVKQTSRKQKLDECLSNLTGFKREQMELLLANVATEKLDEAYKRYIGRILAEDKKEDKKVLSEDKKQQPGKTTVATGDQLNEDKKEVKNADLLARLRELGGVN
jgi:hypothetical protein